MGMHQLYYIEAGKETTRRFTVPAYEIPCIIEAWPGQITSGPLPLPDAREITDHQSELTRMLSVYGPSAHRLYPTLTSLEPAIAQSEQDTNAWLIAEEDRRLGDEQAAEEAAAQAAADYAAAEAAKATTNADMQAAAAQAAADSAAAQAKVDATKDKRAALKQ